MRVELRGGRSLKGVGCSVQAPPQLPARFETAGADALGKCHVGHLQARARLVVEPEGVVGRAQQSATLAHHSLMALVKLATQNHVGRQRRALDRATGRQSSPCSAA